MVQLKPFNLQNVSIHYKWNNDPELAYYDSEYPHAHESFESFLKRIKSVVDESNEATELFEIHLSENDKLIGIVELHAIDTYNKRCYVNCTIGDRDYTGQGYDVDALKSILEYCFHEKKLHKVATTAFDFNAPWINKVKKIGFSKEGELREHVLKKGSFCNKLIFSILSAEFEHSLQRSEVLTEH